MALTLLVGLWPGIWGAPGLAADLPAGPAREKYLLLDSRLIDQTDNVRLAVGTARKHPANPLFREDQPWEPRFDNLYANVLYDEPEGLYKCWYSPFIVDEAVRETPREKRGELPYRPRNREMGVCYAVSQDGLQWEKPALGIVEFAGSKANNIVVRGPHGAGVFQDLREPDPERRYKMFYQGMEVRFSPDGLHWSEPVPCPPIEAAGDTHNNAFWSPELNRYVGITRLWADQRIVGRTESPDFLQWTKAVEVLRGDPQNQTYAMPVFRYAEVYLGLVMILHRSDDRVACELVWSPDTVRWERIDPGTPLIPNAETPGDNDWGCVYAAAYPVVLKDEIRLYYGGSNGPHGGWRDGFLCLATLRPEGFAGYQPVDRDRPGLVITRPVRASGNRLRITADTTGGSVGVTILDAEGHPLAVGGPVTGDVTNAPVRFPPEENPPALKDQVVRLQFTLNRAKMYAFSFD